MVYIQTIGKNILINMRKQKNSYSLRIK